MASTVDLGDVVELGFLVRKDGGIEMPPGARRALQTLWPEIVDAAGGIPRSIRRSTKF